MIIKLFYLFKVKNFNTKKNISTRTKQIMLTFDIQLSSPFKKRKKKFKIKVFILNSFKAFKLKVLS